MLTIELHNRGEDLGCTIREGDTKLYDGNFDDGQLIAINGLLEVNRTGAHTEDKMQSVFRKVIQNFRTLSR